MRFSHSFFLSCFCSHVVCPSSRVVCRPVLSLGLELVHRSSTTAHGVQTKRQTKEEAGGRTHARTCVCGAAASRREEGGKKNGAQEMELWTTNSNSSIISCALALQHEIRCTDGGTKEISEDAARAAAPRDGGDAGCVRAQGVDSRCQRRDHDIHEENNGDKGHVDNAVALVYDSYECHE